MKIKGFTLIELLCAISIACIVCFAGVPGIADLVHKQRAGDAATTLVRAVAQAREQAIRGATYVSICPSADGQHCERTWSSRIIVYRDDNGDGVLEDQSDILHTADLSEGWRVKWSAFGRKPQLTITAQGYTKHQNGSFYVCSREEVGLGKRVAVNKAARARIAPDSNNNGYAEKSNGDDMRC